MLADGLLARMFAASALRDGDGGPDPLAAPGRAAHRAAVQLVGRNDDYPRHLFGELFDVVVISGEVGMRKPEQRIFRHTAALLGLEPPECVFIDDVQANVVAAEAIGLVGLHHREYGPTAERLGGLLGRPLA